MLTGNKPVHHIDSYRQGRENFYFKPMRERFEWKKCLHLDLLEQVFYNRPTLSFIRQRRSR